MARVVQSVVELITLSEYAGVYESRKVSREGNREKCRAVHYMHQNAKDTEITDKEFYVLRSKIYNFPQHKPGNNCKSNNKKSKQKQKCAIRSSMFLNLFYIYIYFSQGQYSHQTEQIFFKYHKLSPGHLP